MKFLSPFGPRIAILKIPSNLLEKLNHEVESIIKNKKKSKSNDYSKKLVGQVQQELELKNKFIKKHLKNFVSKSVNQYLKKNLNKKSKNIKIKNLWVVRQFKNEYNPLHFHDGNVSGVGYLKIPSNLTKSNKKIKTNGTIDFVYGSKSFLNNSIFNHKPKVGDLILFPNYLMHTAYPFKSSGERRSFSFNIEIDKKLTGLLHVK